MTAEPLVSVVMPCLNEEAAIGACIEKIRRTFDTAEIDADTRKVEHPRLGEGDLMDGPRLRPAPVLFGRRLADCLDGVDGNERDALATLGEGEDSTSAADRRRPSAGAWYLRSLDGRLLAALISIHAVGGPAPGSLCARPGVLAVIVIEWLRWEPLPLPHAEWALFGAMVVPLAFSTVFSSLLISGVSRSRRENRQ